MVKVKIAPLIILISMLMMVSCTREGDIGIIASDQKVQVKANIGSTNSNSATTWNDQDDFGLFVKPSGTNGLTTLLANNQQVVFNSTTGSFDLQGPPIYYPQSGAVDLIAYAPFKNGIGQVYPVDVGNQSDQQAIDLLYSNSAQNISKSNSAVPLNFNHQLSKIKFNIQVINGTAITSANISLFGFYDRADFNLVTGLLSNQTVSSRPISLGSTLSGIVIPHNNLANRRIVFSFNNWSWTFELPLTEIFEPGKQYDYTITLKDKEVKIALTQVVPWTKSNVVSPTETVNGYPLDYVYIPAGTFQMGAPDTSETADSYEKPQHWVKISKGFFMSKYETTISQYAQFLNALGVGSAGSGSQNSIYHNINGEDVLLFVVDAQATPIFENNTWKSPVGKENYPMRRVSWYGALAYAHWAGGTLPTEAQWEYAYRAGTKTYFFSGNLAIDFRPFEWFYDSNGTNSVHAVGEKLPNPWGLYDMGGNVSEWALDQVDFLNQYSSNTEQNPTIDPISRFTTQSRVVRGGNYGSSGSLGGAYKRRLKNAFNTDLYTGFRIVINP